MSKVVTPCFLAVLFGLFAFHLYTVNRCSVKFQYVFHKYFFRFQLMQTILCKRWKSAIFLTELDLTSHFAANIHYLLSGLGSMMNVKTELKSYREWRPCKLIENLVNLENVYGFLVCSREARNETSLRKLIRIQLLVSVSVDGTFSNFVQVTSGTPQGGILSSILFSLFINDISDVIDVGFHLYADDAQIYSSSHSITDCTTKINSVLKRVHEWSISQSLAINPLKSHAMVISKKTIPSPPPIFIGASTINYCSELKLLGLIIDSQLNWSSHINKVCREIYAGIAMLTVSTLDASGNKNLPGEGLVDT